MRNSIRIQGTVADSPYSDSSGAVTGQFLHALIGLLLFLVFLPPAFGQSGDSKAVRYTLSPVVSGTAWNSDLGLKDRFLYGGKLGIDFGPLIGLEATYLTSSDFRTDFAEIGLRDTAGVIVGDQHVKVKRYGGDLLFRWPSVRFAPFVRVGGGVIRFEPESGQKTERVDVRFGGGLDYVLTNRLRTRAWVEMNRFRLDRYSLAPGGATSGQYPVDTEADEIRNNLSVSLSLDYAIGRSRFRATGAEERLRPFSVLELEPEVGRIEFDDSRMPTVTVAGGRIGGELNPWVGWGLYYWHAMESDLADTRPLQSYGGEARFNLASKAGPQPYLTIGAGQLDFGSAYRDDEGTQRDDRTALIMGAGIRAEVFSGLQLNISVRDLMYGEGRLDRVSGTDEINHNWLLSGGLVFGVGGLSDGAKPRPLPPEPVSLPLKVASDVSDTTLPSEEPPPIGDDSTIVASQPTQATATSYVSDKNVVIPVPLEGEIYIRYGRPSRDLERRGPEAVTQDQAIQTDSSVSRTLPGKPEAIEPTRLPEIAPSPDTAVSVAPRREAEGIAPVSRSELDSLINVLKSDISTMLAVQATEPKTGAQEPQQESADSIVAQLEQELAASEAERRRLDSLLRMQVAAAEAVQDSLIDQQIQQAIVDQVATALAAKTEDTAKEITQADLQDMMAILTAKMDSAAAQRATSDSVRLRDQLQLEITKQTKSQEEFQRAMEDFLERYGKRQESQVGTPPAIIVTQPAPTPQVVERDEPPTVIIKPDTQYVVIRDSTGEAARPLPVKDLDVVAPPEEKDFIDLNPSGYIGFGLETPKQFVLGGRLDIGPITAKEERLRLVPEFALGLGGGGVSVMAVMNAEYAIADLETGDYQIVPYARMGFGVVGFGGDIEDRETEGVLNFTYGVSIDPSKTGVLRGIGDPAVFVEHQIIDLFDLNRVVMGLQWSP